MKSSLALQNIGNAKFLSIELRVSLLNVFRVIKSREMRCVGHEARTWEMTNAYEILVGRLGGKVHFGDLAVSGRMILKWIFI
jgi:hypothetical protein